MFALSRANVAAWLALAGLAAGHRSLPPGVTCGNQFASWDTALEVPNPVISWASYRILTCDAPVFWLRAEDVIVDQPLYMTITVPVLDRFAGVRVSVLVIGPGLPPLSGRPEESMVPTEVRDQVAFLEEGAVLFTSPEDQSSCAHLGSDMMAEASDVTDGRCHFHEPYGDTHSWVLLDDMLTASAGGTFHFAIFTSDGSPAKLAFACCDWPEDFATAYPMPDAECPYCGTMSSFSAWNSHFYETKDMAVHGGFPAAGDCSVIGDGPTEPSEAQCPDETPDDNGEQQGTCSLGCSNGECHSHNIFGECTYPMKWVKPTPSINGYNVTSLILFKGETVYFYSGGDFWPHNLELMASESKLESCDFSGSTQILSVVQVGSGTAVTFDQEGTFYYSCGITGHCELGQKLTVEVKDVSEGMRCHDHAATDPEVEVVCEGGEVNAHVLANSDYGAMANQCSEFCTSPMGLFFIPGGTQGTCSEVGYSITIAEMTVQPPGSPMAMDVVVKGKPDPNISCQTGEVIAYVLGDSEYGAEADQCSEFCTTPMALFFTPDATEGACSGIGYTVTVSEQIVQPTGSPMAVRVFVKSMPPACHCHSYEEIACSSVGDALYDEHINEIATYCQEVISGTEDTCPYKCFQPFEVLHLHYLECSYRPEHPLYAQIAATDMCHLAADAPSADDCLAPSPTPCADNDPRAIRVASRAGFTISGCADVGMFCEHAAHGSTVQAICPVTCGLCPLCADDDPRAIALASGAGYTISGCADVGRFCEHPAHGSTVQRICPVTCDSCAAPGRRLADGKDPIVDKLDLSEEMMVVSPTLAPAAGIRQKTEEFSISDAKLFYP